MRSPSAFSCLFAAIFAPFLLAAQGASDPNEIAALLPPRALHPGDLITLTGRLRFNPGELRNLQFFLGTTALTPAALDADAVVVTVPNVPGGAYDLIVAKDGDPPGRDIVLFRTSVIVERLMESQAATIGTAGGELRTGPLRLVLPPDSTRTQRHYVLEQIENPLDTEDFLNELTQSGTLITQNLPRIADTAYFRFGSSLAGEENVMGRLVVGDVFLEAIPPGMRPALYYEETQSGADDEEITEQRRLDTAYDPVRRELSFRIDGTLFTSRESLSVASALGAATRGAAGAKAGIVKFRLSVQASAEEESIVRRTPKSKM